MRSALLRSKEIEMTKRLPAAARAVAFALAGAVLVPLSTTGQEIDVAALQEVDDVRTDVQHNGFTVEQIETPIARAILAVPMFEEWMNTSGTVSTRRVGWKSSMRKRP